MSKLIYRKSWTSAANNTERFPASAMVDLQNDIASKINGGLTDSNISTSAAIVESKVAFDITVGHNHDGLNSRLLASANTPATNTPHIRNGLTLTRYDQSTIQVSTGYCVIDGALLKLTAPMTLNMATSGSFILGAEAASIPVYIYMSNAGTAASSSPVLNFSTEAPDLGNTDDGVAEFPVRYQKYSSVYYRCLGVCYNNASSNIDAGSVLSFDASNHAFGYFTADGSAKTVTTVWTPTYVTTHYTNTAPVDGNRSDLAESSADLLAGSVLANSYNDGTPTQLYKTASTLVGGVKTITAQSTSTAGSFVVHNPASGKVVYWEAMTCGTRGA